MEIYGYKRSYARTIITWIAIVASGFLLRLIFFWKPHWMLYMTFKRCSLREAEKVLLIDKYNQCFVEKVSHLHGVPHPSELVQRKGTYYNNNNNSITCQDDDDDILECPDKDQFDGHQWASSPHGNNYGSTSKTASNQYGSLAPRVPFKAASPSNRRRKRTLSSRSNKSAPLTENSDALDSSSDDCDSDSLSVSQDGDCDHDTRPGTPTTLTAHGHLGSQELSRQKEDNQKDQDQDLEQGVGAGQGRDEEPDRDDGIRYFDNKKLRYIWYDDECNFVRLRGYDKHTPYSKLQKMTDGLSSEEQARRRFLFGDNAIHVEVLPYVKILFQEVLGPFYIFQVFSCTVWFNDDYYYYGSCIIVMSILSLVSSVIQIRRNQEQLRDTVESLDYVKVCRGRDQIEEIDSSQLVPGDIVVVPTFNSVLQFDGILINGNVIVNESMLTGESVPVTKTPLPLSNYTTTSKSSSAAAAGAAAATVAAAAAAAAAKQRNEMYYDEKEHGKHTLFCGTKVLQTRYYGGVHVKALVIRVGFQTAKGELIRSIMFPKPVDFRFSKQIHKFIGLLACIAMIGFTYSVVLKSHRGADFKTILISALDLITIVVPPALPAAMTIGIIYAQSRLMKNKIFCISPRSINISGCINCVCFDKTGTLTEDDLSFNEVVPLIESSCKFGRPFDEEVMQTSLKQVERDHHLLLDSGNYSPLMICLAACHSLTIIDQKLIGDPLDLQMFEATGWVLEEPDVDDENKFDLLAPTVVRPPRRKRRTAPEASEYASSAEFPSSGSSTDEDELQMQMQLQQQQQHQKQQGKQLDVVSVNTTQKCQSDVGILRQFPFSSSLQRMSVIARQFSGSQYVVYAKGAPEKIASLCDPATMPDDFNEVLHDYTQKGFRVLALAYRPLKVGLSYTRMQRATRADIEKDLKFLGLLTLGNLLKPETIPVISTLNRASIRCVMVTGDNMLTAVSVANECGMIASHDRTVLLQVDKVNKKQQGGGGGGGGSSEQITPVPSREHLQAVPEATLTNNSAATIIAVGDGGDDQSANDDKPQQVLDYELPRPAAVQLLTSEQSTLPTSGGGGGDGNVNQLVLSVESIQLQTRTESEPILAQKRTKDPPRPKLIWNYINDSSPTTNNNNNSATNNNHMVKRDSGHSGGGRCGGCVRIDMLEDTRIHLALTGETWDVILRHYPELLNAICVRGTVFARMSPHQKQQLVEHLQTLQYYVGMCGDGANDSGALRAAHAGISLSDTEASVAAPFTSANANISCVPILIGEGRAALVTAFGILKYMALYSLIQFCSVLLLYTMYTNFTDKEFLYEDLFIIATFVALFGRTEPYPTLANKPPPSSLLSVTQLASVSIQLVLVIFFQVLSLVLLWNNDWYKPHPQNYDHDLAGHDNYAIFAISAFQCISLAVVFSKGKPYKKSIMSNYLFTGALAVITVTTITILIIRAEWNIPYISLEVLDVSLEFRVLMILLAFSHFALAMLGERYIVDHLIFEKSDKFLELFGMKSKKSLFESIDQKTRSSMHWLKMSTKDSIVSGL